MSMSTYLHRNALGWLIAIPIVAVENLLALIIISSRKRWKSPDVLLFSITLGHLLSLLLPLLLYAVIVFVSNTWTDDSCRFLVWCVMSFRIVGAVNIAFIALDRVWTLKWPSSYRAHNSSRQTARTAVFMWLFGVAIGTIPLISWARLEEGQTCSLVLNIAGYGYAMCIVIIVLGSVIVSSVCIVTIVVNVVFVLPLLPEPDDPKSSIPQIVIESETGERTSAVAGSRDSQNQQIYLLVSSVVILYFCLNGLPFVVINIIAFTLGTPSIWMSVAITWCSILTAFLHPPLLVLICNRYRKVYQRLFRSVGESCGCVKPPPPRTSINGVTRQETFDSLDDFSSDEEDKLHFPTPDWSDQSFSGSIDEGAGPSTDVVIASTSTAIQTVTVVEHSHTVRNGKLPSKSSSPKTETVVYDNKAFVSEEESKKNKGKRHKSPKMTPEQKRAMWQGHRGARKRLEALKHAHAERAASAHSSKGKKSKSHQEKRGSKKQNEDKNLRVEAPVTNRHRKLERLSTKHHSLDSLTVPTKRKRPLVSSRSLDQDRNTMTVEVEVETARVGRKGYAEPLVDKKSSSSKTKKSESKLHSNHKRSQTSTKKESSATASSQKKDCTITATKKEHIVTLSPKSSPTHSDKRDTGEGGKHRPARFEMPRENYNSDFSSFGSGELYDIPEESPEEMLGESSGWNPTTVNALKAQHRDDKSPIRGRRSPTGGGGKKLAQKKHLEKQRQRNGAAPDLTPTPAPLAWERKPPRRALSRQLSQDHTRSFDSGVIEMSELGSRDSTSAFSYDQERNTPLSTLHINLTESDLNDDQTTYYIAKDLRKNRKRETSPDAAEGIILEDNLPPAVGGSHLDGFGPGEEDSEQRTSVKVQSLLVRTPSDHDLTGEGLQDDRAQLSKSSSTGGRPSAKDMREMYRKSHLSMAAIFESIRDDSHEVVFL
ncbi:uncharacterized protein [Diadema antillarum]|uniref:uncharacterized protein n=1 Tax=Diadema antillarum TaxID=105358 RepID=UPI003A8BEA40